MLDSAPTVDGAEWASRSAYWLAESEPKHTRKRRQREEHPLFLTGHGMSIRVDKGCLIVKDGNTHYPADAREWRFFNGALDIPPAIVVIDGSGEITLDAIDWLATQGVPLIRLRWDGQFTSVISTGGQAASTEKVRWQEETRRTPELRLAFGLEVLKRKAANTLTTLERCIPKSSAWVTAHKNIVAYTRSLNSSPPRDVSKLLGVEGAIAHEYFRTWRAITPKWRAVKQHPIPEDWRKFTSRSALRAGKLGNYRATHPVNAMLNYAYGVLLARMQIQLIADGYDPMIGVIHDDGKGRDNCPAFALDHMESMRPVVDRVILNLIATQTFTGADFSIQHDGVCRLNPELARRVVQLATDATRSIEAERPRPQMARKPAGR